MLFSNVTRKAKATKLIAETLIIISQYLGPVRLIQINIQIIIIF